MRTAICMVALTFMLAYGSVALAQTFDPNAYKDLVDSTSSETIAPGTKITLQNWTQYKRFMGTWMQLAFSGKVHFHVADTPDYTVVVAPTGNYPIPKEMREAKVDDRDVGRIEAIICSMTPVERSDPMVLDGSRRLRIARGSGSSTTEVNNLLRQFKEMQKMMRGLGPMSKLAGGRAGKAGKPGKGSRKKVKGGRVTPSSRGLGPTR